MPSPSSEVKQVAGLERVRTAVTRMRRGAMVEMDADGHVAPILEHADKLAEIIKVFWRDAGAYVVR